MIQANVNIVPHILCGGSGTRLWPLSREAFPKQFVPLIQGMSKRKQRPAQFKTSALESARRAGFAGVFAGPPDLAANRKKYRTASNHHA